VPAASSVFIRSNMLFHHVSELGRDVARDKRAKYDYPGKASSTSSA